MMLKKLSEEDGFKYLENSNFWKIEASFLKKEKNYPAEKKRIIYIKIFGMKFAVINIKYNTMNPSIYHMLYIVYCMPKTI